MTSVASPFTPGKSIEHDRRFVDQIRVLERILRCLNAGKSCSIIGGVGMGKTSILKRLWRMFFQKNAPSNSLFRFIPIYFSADLRESDSLRSIYQQLIQATISQTKKWLQSCVPDAPKTVFDDLDFSCRLMGPGPTELDEDCKAFEGDFWEVIKAIRHAVANTKLLFLLDNVYQIEDPSVREALVRHWFELLDEDKPEKETVRSHLALVIACSRHHVEQFVKRRFDSTVGPTPDPLEPVYLQVFGRDDVSQLINPPFKDTLGKELEDDVVDAVYSITGGHPFLLHSVMSDLWVEAGAKTSIDVPYIQSCIPTWSGIYPRVYHWTSKVLSSSVMLSSVFDLLLTRDGVWERATLDEELEKSSVGLRYGYQLMDTIRLLKSLGLISEVPKNAYQVSGQLFREWFKPIKGTQPGGDIAMTDQYVDFELHIGPSGHATAISDQGRAIADVSTDVPNAIRLSTRLIEKRETDRELLEILGRELYTWLFPGPIHTHFQQTEAVARDNGAKIRVRLNIEADSLASLPLEFAYRSIGSYFLANHPDTVLSRYLNLPLPEDRVRRREGPLYLLTIIANPSDQESLDPDDWEKIVCQALDRPIQEGRIVVDTVKHATRREIRGALLKQEPDIIQFVGHGVYRDGKGYLALVNEKTGKTWRVDDESFANMLMGFSDHLGLVCLATCESAKSDSPQGFRGIAPKIVERGTPAVVAMQYRVLVETAKIFLEELYLAIAHRKPVDWAVQNARNAIAIEKGLDNREFASPVLYMRAKDGEIF